MTALIIDTSGGVGYVALGLAGEVVKVVTLPQGRGLSKSLFDSIILLVEGRKIDFIAVGTGPGTFTGTRVGAMAAEALSYGWETPMIPFSSSYLPDLVKVATKTYASFLAREFCSQIELVYISKTP